jgi:hypothetical protein
VRFPRRFGFAALVAVMVVGIGFVSDATSPADTSHARDARVTAPGARVTAGSAAHAERRAPVDRGGWAPACATACGGWVRLLSSAANLTENEAAPARGRSRAPPV